jgi:hypothetical protein
MITRCLRFLVEHFLKVCGSRQGNTLVLEQVEQLLEQGRAVGNRELREYMAGAGPGRAPRVACSVDRVHVSLWVAEPE